MMRPCGVDFKRHCSRGFGRELAQDRFGISVTNSREGNLLLVIALSAQGLPKMIKNASYAVVICQHWITGHVDHLMEHPYYCFGGFLE